MSFAIGRRLRTFLIFVSAGAYVVSLSDVSERLDAQDLSTQQSASLAFYERRSPPPIATVIRRDPFMGEPEPRPLESQPGSNGSANAGLGDRSDGPAVPDIALGGAPPGDGAPAATPFAARATIVGTHSVAYVAQGATLQLVRVGDVLAGRRVTRIDLRGVALSDGTRLDLPGSYLATPLATVPAASRIDAALAEIARLRAQLAARATEAPIESAPSTPAAVPTQAATTPGPLPTVDARGLPVGVNPTPDAAGPTALPYPYPYAPPPR